MPRVDPIASAPPPVPNASERLLLKEEAYRRLKQRIVDGLLSPGTFLSERQLAVQLGMSKTPVRAALERLDAEGLVKVSPQQGIVVRELSIHEIADQFEIRLALEAHVARALAGRLSAEQERRVREQLRAQEESVRCGDIEQNVLLDMEFHLMFCEFLGNQEILRVMWQLRDKIGRVIRHVLAGNGDRLGVGYDEHLAIAEAILAGHAEAAAERLQSHLEYGKQFLLSRGRA